VVNFALAAHTATVSVDKPLIKGGSSVELTFTITKTSGDNLQYIYITLPAGFTYSSAVCPLDWSAVILGSSFKCDGDLSSQSITGSATVKLTVTPPLTNSPYEWVTRTKDTVGVSVTLTPAPITTTDSLAPTISTITTKDANGDGKVETATIVFSEAVDDSTFSQANFTLGGQAVNTINTGTADDNTFDIVVTAGIAGTEAKDVTYTPGSGADIVGNPLAAVFTGTITEIDGAAPVAISAQTKTTTTIDVTFSEDINGGSDNPADFTVAGSVVTATSELNGVVTLTLQNPIAPNATPLITVHGNGVSSGLEDLNGRWTTEHSAPSTIDGIAPTFTAVRTGINTITLTFSENVDVTTVDGSGYTLSAGTVTVNTDPAGTSNTITLTTSGLTGTSETPTVTYGIAAGTTVDVAVNEVVNGASAVATDGIAPVISATAPATNAFIKTQTVSYTLSEAAVAASGVIVFTRTGGTADTSHTCTLQGSALASGAHANLILINDANVCTGWTSLVDGSIYTVTFNATDAAGNAAITVTNTGVTFDTTPPTGTVTRGTATIYEGDLVQEITVTYNEDMKPTPTPTITLAGNVGAITTSGNGTWTTARIWNETFNVVDVNEETAGVTVNSSLAQDLAGNAEGADVQATFNIDTKTPTVPTIGTFTAVGGNLVAVSINSTNTGFTLTFTSPAANFAGTAHLYVGGLEFATPVTVAVSDASTLYTLTGNGTSITGLGVDGAKSLTVKIIDAAGNISSASAASDITKDTVVPTFTSVAIGADAYVNAAETADGVNIAITTTGLENGRTVSCTITGTVGSVGPVTGAVTTNAVTIASTALTALADGTITATCSVSDAAGNPAVNGTDTAIKDVLKPTISSINVNDSLITEVDLGVDKFVVTIVFTDANAMDTGTAPTIAFDPTLDTTLTNCAGVWSSYTYTYTCDVADVSVEQADEDIDVSGAKDVAGNIMDANITSGVDKFSVDTKTPDAPTIGAFAPVGGTATPAYINNTNTGFTLTFTSPAANFVGTAHLYVDGVEFATPVTVAVVAGNTLYTLTGNGTSITGLGANGAKALTVVIVDAAENISAASAASNITKDTLAPTLTTVTIASNNVNPIWAKVGDTVTLTIVGSENLTAKPTVTIRGHAIDPANVVLVGDAQHWTATYAMVEGDAEGVVPFTINFTDIAINSGVQVVTKTGGSDVTFDKTTPTVALTYSADPAKAGSVIVTATYSSAVASTPNISIDQPGTTDITTQAMTPGASGVYTYDYTVNVANAGTYVDGDATVSLSAITDAAGNTAGAPANTTFTIDTGVPTASISSPVADAVVKSASVSLEFVSTGGSACAYKVGGGSYIALADCTSPRTITLSDGRNSIILKVTDSAGNYTESAAVSFVVDTNNNLTVGATGADFTTIQAAINAATAGDTISVAAGTYTENVNVNKSVTLTGASSATVTVTAASQTDSVFTVAANNVQISGFTAKHTIMTGNEGYAGIKFNSGVTGCSIHDNILTNNQYGILLIEPENSTTPGNNTFTNNDASSNGVSGIEMQHSYGNTFTNNIASSNGSYGFKLDSARNNTFTGNTANLNQRGFYLTTGSGIGSNSNTFTNNTANSNTKHGIHLIGISNSNTLTGNTFSGNTTTGIKLQGEVSSLALSSNTITNSLTGINVSSESNPTFPNVATWTMTNNKISGNTTGVSNSGTGSLGAAQNWWGNIEGPKIASNPYGILGDSIVGTVIYASWCTVEDCSGYDTTAPTASLTGTPAALTKLTTTNITVGGTGVVYYKYNLDGVGDYSAETAVSSNIGLSGLSTGSHTLFVIGRDQAGNWQAEGSATTHPWTVDAGVPTLAAVTIASNNANSTALAKVGDTITLTFIASENLTAKPTVAIATHAIVAGNVVQGSDAAHWTATYVMASGDTEGVVPFTINFTDIATNAGTEVTATIGGSSVTFDKTAPTASEVTPVTALGKDSTPDVIINVELGVAWQIKNGGSVLNSGTGTGAAQTVTIASLADGTYNLSLVATDAAGNQTTIPLTQFVVDTTVPTLTLNSPFTGMTLTGGNIYSITWTASDLHLSTTPIKLEYSIDGGTIWTTIAAATANDGTENWTVPSTNSSNCKIRITATDLATNTNNVVGGTFTITYSIVTDTTAPVATLNSPNGGETWENNVAHTITWTATDNITAAASIRIKLEYSTDGGTTWPDIIADMANDGFYSWTPTGINSSNVLLKVTATDAASLTGSDISNNVFTISTPVSYPTSSCTGTGPYTCTIALSTGWNLISLPIIPTSSAIATVLSGVVSNMDIAKYYTQSGWLSYKPSVYTTLTTMEDGKGYWINMTAPATLTVTGTSAPEAPNPPSTYSVISGWNLIGYKSVTAYKNTSTYLSTIPSGYMVFDQNNADKTSSYLQHGKGYWLWSTGVGSFIAAD